jgi:Poly(ADP-ribose) polymerase and DNA-Ligase Zn-finger region
MAHVFEPAASGRSKCRGCGEALQKGDIRFGERLPNPFADGAEMTLWYHPLCAAYKRPEAMLGSLAHAPGGLDRPQLDEAARLGVAHRRLPRIDGAERSPSGQASCRSCREPITKGAWRIRIAIYDEGRFNPAGYVHLACSREYFETVEVVDRALHFSPKLTQAERDELRSAAPLG